MCACACVYVRCLCYFYGLSWCNVWMWKKDYVYNTTKVYFFFNLFMAEAREHTLKIIRRHHFKVTCRVWGAYLPLWCLFLGVCWWRVENCCSFPRKSSHRGNKQQAVYSVGHGWDLVSACKGLPSNSFLSKTVESSRQSLVTQHPPI